MNRWEYRQEILNFRKIRTTYHGRQIPVSAIHFSYFNFPNHNTLEYERSRADTLIHQVILDYANQYGAEGWELDHFNTTRRDGENYPVGLLVL